MVVIKATSGTIRFAGIKNKAISLMTTGELQAELARVGHDLHVLKVFGPKMDPTCRRERNCLVAEQRRIDAELARRGEVVA